MKKIFKFLLVALFMFIGIFSLTGCDKNTKNETKVEESKYKTYAVESTFGGTLSFEFPKESKYEFSTDTNTAKLYNSEDKSSIEFFLMNTSERSIILGEKDFASDVYKDYEKTKLGGYDAYKITYHSGYMTRIEMGLLLDRYDSDNSKNHGVKIKISQHATDSEGMFNPEAYFKSEDFQHILDTIKFTYVSEDE